ncbi:MAG: 16S rRNA (guanine(966)-N(2))-methyltransferase RsmD [Candidatus Acetothermia bacterium]|jgi:16S rRNA (guanine(966)-N(2))-methyltransferase RsmD|nr:16S rRNA (guanine(966)-N(2))-methyltransferase RsmD [Candidatus Acetothermia bacterium]MDH7505023.1 16S rRNA (guanine(966)-N(2))-methyltransferase RsmD [Candidatus Acetothermia bacterium]
MRVVGGEKGGARLLELEHEQIRPMRAEVRAGLFNMIQDFVPESRFLDLFAGTGSVGIEALSRGAAECTFVDNLPEAVRLIKMNLAKLGLTGRAKVYQLDVFEALARFERRGRRYDLVFIGPPYGQGLGVRTLARLASSSILSDDSLVIVELFKKERPEVGESYGQLGLVRERRYGDNLILIYRRGQPVPSVEQDGQDRGRGQGQARGESEPPQEGP